MSKLNRTLFALGILSLALVLVIARQPAGAQAASGSFIVTLTPTGVTVTDTPVVTETPPPTQTAVTPPPSATPTSGVVPPVNSPTPTLAPPIASPTATPDGDGEDGEDDGEPRPSRTPEAAILPVTGETPPLAPGGPGQIWIIGGIGLAVGLLLGLGLRRRMLSWLVRFFGVFLVVALLGLQAHSVKAPGAAASQPAQAQAVQADQGVAPF